MKIVRRWSENFSFEYIKRVYVKILFEYNYDETNEWRINATKTVDFLSIEDR